MRLLVAPLLLACLPPVVAAADPTATAADHQAVREAILDYVEGVYQSDPSRIERSVHPELAKRGFNRTKANPEYSESKMTYERLLEVAKSFNAKKWVPATAPKEIVIYEVQDKTAVAKLTAIWGTDYFHLGKYGDRWKIVNVIWQSPMGSTN